jgi:hypothetical protein
MYKLLLFYQINYHFQVTTKHFYDILPSFHKKCESNFSRTDKWWREKTHASIFSHM